MSYFNKIFGKRLFVLMSALTIALGLGFASTGTALANDDHHDRHRGDRHHEGDRHRGDRHHEGDREEDNRFVVVNGTRYEVNHNSGGPFIRVNGMDIFLEGSGSNRFVMVNGKRFDVSGDEERHGDERHGDERHHEGDRHHREDRHHNRD